MGLDVRLPDINASAKSYTGRSGEARHASGSVSRGWVRVGLQQIKGLRDEAIGTIGDERQRRGPFASFDDFLRRVPIAPSDSRLLIRAGAFDRLGFGAGDRRGGLDLRPRLHWRLHEWEARTEGRQRRGDLLFPPELGPLPHPRPYAAAKLLRDEADTLGFLVSRHPLSLYRDDLLALRRAGVRAVRGIDLARHAGRRVTSIGWLVTGKVVTT